MQRPWLDILLDKIKELGEDTKTLKIDGDLKEVNREFTQYPDGDYDNGVDFEKIKVFTKNYIYWFDLINTDSYQRVIAIPRNPTAGAWNYEEIMSSRDVA